MGEIESLIEGLCWLAVGIAALMNVRRFTKMMNESWLSFQRIGKASDGDRKVRSLVPSILIRIIGFSFVMGGLLQLYSFITGEDWPFHYMS